MQNEGVRKLILKFHQYWGITYLSESDLLFQLTKQSLEIVEDVFDMR